MPLTPPLDRSANLFGRLATIAGTYGIPATQWLDRLSPLATEVGQLSLVTTSDRFDELAVMTQIPRTAIERVRVVLPAAQQSRVQRLIAHETKEVDLEIASSGSTAVLAFGKRSVGDDLSRLSPYLQERSRLALADALGSLLGDGARYIALSDCEKDNVASWTCHVEHDNSDASRTASRLDAAAQALGVTAAQRHVVGGLHDVLSSGDRSYALLSMRSDAVAPELGVMWANVSWELLVRIMLGFYPDRDVARRLGELAGAFDAERASSVVLVLGATEPPRMRMSVSSTKGERRT